MQTKPIVFALLGSTTGVHRNRLSNCVKADGLLFINAFNSQSVIIRRPASAASSYASCHPYGDSSVLKKTCGPAESLYLPAGQLTQVRRVESTENLPAGHSAHALLSMPASCEFRSADTCAKTSFGRCEFQIYTEESCQSLCSPESLGFIISLQLPVPPWS